MRRAAAVLAVLLVFTLPGPAADGTLPERARILMDYQSFMRGDGDGAVRFVLNASRDMQGTPLAELAVRIALLYEPAGLSSVAVGEAEARRILGAGSGEISAELRDLLRRFVARNYAAAGRREEALDMHRRRGLAMSWYLAGPFPGYRAASFESRELPAAGPVIKGDVIEEPPDAERFREWRRAPPWRVLPENRAFPYVRPWRRTADDNDGAMLLTTGLELAAADNRASFHILSETSWRLYVDGILVSELDRNAREAPAEHTVPFALSAGTHTVTLQLFPPGAGLSLQDIRASVRLDSTVSFTWDREAADLSLTATANARREPRRMKYLTDLEDLIETDPSVMAAYAVACLEQGMRDEAAWWAEKAARAAPADVSIQFLAGALTSLNPLLPEERRRDTAAAWHRSALERNPGIVPSLIFLAETAMAAGSPREADAYLRRAYEANPGSLDVLMARGNWASRFASAATARAAWDECARAFPNSPAVQVAAASIPQEGFLDMDRRLAACRAAVAAGPYLSVASIRLAEALADSGNSQEAEAVLRNARALFAGEVQVLADIAEIYARLSVYPEAIDLMAEAVRLVPENYRYWRRLGDFHMEAGDEDRAMRYWRVSLAANPGQFELADMTDFLAGDPPDLYGEGGYDAIAMTAETDSSLFPGDVVRLLDRSVLTFTDDGSFRRLTHDVDLARTRRGGEGLAGITRQGEILTARIVFPNGNTLEPEPYPGQGGLRLPVIMPGASREIRVLEAVTSPWSEPPSVKPWYFQDPSGRMPLVISEYVVYAPRGFPLVHVTQDFGSTVDFEFSQEEEYDVYRWTAALSLPSHEPDAVHISERVPSVSVGVKTSWENVVFTELRRLDGLLIPSQRMRALLDTLYRPEPNSVPDPEEAARAVYRYVCDNIDAAAGSPLAAHIQADRMGDRITLLLALLRAAGLDAHPAAARQAAAFMAPPAWDLPNRRLFPVSMVRLEIPGGKVFYLDVRFDSLPFGKITDDLSGAAVLTFLPSGPLFETLPVLPSEESAVLHERTLRLPAGSEPVSVSIRSVRRGVAGLRRGEELAEADMEGRRNLVLSALFPVFPDAVLQRFDVIRPDEANAVSQERCEIASASAAEARPGGIRALPLGLIPPQVISPETRNMTRRETTCHIRSIHMAEDRNIFVLPAGGKFTRLPDPALIPTRFGVYQLRILPHGENGAEVVRTYHIPAQRIPPWDWEDFIGFLERIDLAERQWVEYSIEETVPAGD